jgi:NADH-quinone oxidoreductase subunit A
MGSDFTPLFLYILIAVLLAAGMLIGSALINPGRGRGNPIKAMPYESGMDPIGDTRQRFDVRYHLIAIAFLLFDVELLFLYPWAVGQWSVGTPPIAPAVVAAQTDPTVVRALQAATDTGIPPEFRNAAFLGAMVFLAIVVAGYAYDWRKGVFEWR